MPIVHCVANRREHWNHSSGQARTDASMVCWFKKATATAITAAVTPWVNSRIIRNCPLEARPPLTPCHTSLQRCHHQCTQWRNKGQSLPPLMRADFAWNWVMCLSQSQWAAIDIMHMPATHMHSNVGCHQLRCMLAYGGSFRCIDEYYPYTDHSLACLYALSGSSWGCVFLQEKHQSTYCPSEAVCQFPWPAHSLDLSLTKYVGNWTG